MPTVANYAIPRMIDGPSSDKPVHIVPADDSPELEFSIDDNALVKGTRRREQPGILWYVVDPTIMTVKDVKIEISINGKLVAGYGPTSANFVRAFHEIVDKGILKTGTNKMMLTYKSGKGQVAVSDIIIFFKVQIAD